MEFPGFFVKAAFATALAIGLADCAPKADTGQGPVVLAPASLQGALDEVAHLWSQQDNPAPVLSFAATPALARQISGGAPADLVITADPQWMDWLDGQGLIEAGTRRDLLGNRLVVVRRFGAQQARLNALADTARLALAEPGSVPAGRYAKAALVSLGLWTGLADNVVPAESVRAALALVERGEAELGIVYASDALASDKVEIVEALAPQSHPPIRYFVALVARSGHRDAAEFARFLASEAAQSKFAEHGFEAMQ